MAKLIKEIPPALHQFIIHHCLCYGGKLCIM